MRALDGGVDVALIHPELLHFLPRGERRLGIAELLRFAPVRQRCRAWRLEIGTSLGALRTLQPGIGKGLHVAIGDRKSVVEGKSVSVRVDLGGRGIIKKKKNKKTH